MNRDAACHPVCSSSVLFARGSRKPKQLCRGRGRDAEGSRGLLHSSTPMAMFVLPSRHAQGTEEEEDEGRAFRAFETLVQLKNVYGLSSRFGNSAPSDFSIRSTLQPVSPMCSRSISFLRLELPLLSTDWSNVWTNMCLQRESLQGDEWRTKGESSLSSGA
ncbi:hypothetical protein JZ751_028576 [Albula glossodonta]|uniref:Uncharacterized protein n=1 Tax=Albula glossodonta TaxID=121402 RepID=A0A8T2MMC6_9TELE|nr:hypothetical protein JZ751_010779 [Albula glossodonta]KAG9337559.1 hypothetical protein JZ751_028576 [Albula glossodonta]